MVRTLSLLVLGGALSGCIGVVFLPAPPVTDPAAALVTVGRLQHPALERAWGGPNPTPTKSGLALWLTPQAVLEIAPKEGRLVRALPVEEATHLWVTEERLYVSLGWEQMRTWELAALDRSSGRELWRIHSPVQEYRVRAGVLSPLTGPIANIDLRPRRDGAVQLVGAATMWAGGGANMTVEVDGATGTIRDGASFPLRMELDEGSELWIDAAPQQGGPVGRVFRRSGADTVETFPVDPADYADTPRSHEGPPGLGARMPYVPSADGALHTYGEVFSARLFGDTLFVTATTTPEDADAPSTSRTLVYDLDRQRKVADFATPAVASFQYPCRAGRVEWGDTCFLAFDRRFGGDVRGVAVLDVKARAWRVIDAPVPGGVTVPYDTGEHDLAGEAPAGSGKMRLAFVDAHSEAHVWVVGGGAPVSLGKVGVRFTTDDLTPGIVSLDDAVLVAGPDTLRVHSLDGGLIDTLERPCPGVMVRRFPGGAVILNTHHTHSANHGEVCSVSVRANRRFVLRAAAPPVALGTLGQVEIVPLGADSTRWRAVVTGCDPRACHVLGYELTTGAVAFRQPLAGLETGDTPLPAEIAVLRGRSDVEGAWLFAQSGADTADVLRLR